MDWLLVDDGAWWLWSTDTGREVFDCSFNRDGNWQEAAQERLESAILAGPPREMYRDDLQPERWHAWGSFCLVHLAKLNASGLPWGHSQRHAWWNCPMHARNCSWQPTSVTKFSHWMSGTGDPD